MLCALANGKTEYFERRDIELLVRNRFFGSSRVACLINKLGEKFEILWEDHASFQNFP
jgi:hypothetical protein